MPLRKTRRLPDPKGWVIKRAAEALSKETIIRALAAKGYNKKAAKRLIIRASRDERILKFPKGRQQLIFWVLRKEGWKKKKR